MAVKFGNPYITPTGLPNGAPVPESRQPQAPAAPAASSGASGAPLDYNAPLTPEEQAELEKYVNDNLSNIWNHPEAVRDYEQQIRSRRASSAMERFTSESERLAQELGEGGYDQQRYSEYERKLNEPVEADFFNQAGSASAYLARQGLGGSGINIATHQGLAANKNSIENQGRRLALDMARQAKRQETLDEFSTRLAAMGPVLSKYGIDVNTFLALKQMELQRQAQENANDAAMFGSIGRAGALGIGMAYGGPAGAVAANEIDPSLFYTDYSGT